MCDGLLKLDSIYPLRVRLQPISTTISEDHVSQSAPEIRDVGLQRGTGRGGRLVTPKAVDERVNRDDFPDLGHQERQDCALLRASQPNVDTLVHSLDRPENPYVHVGTICRFAPSRRRPNGRVLHAGHGRNRRPIRSRNPPRRSTQPSARAGPSFDPNGLCLLCLGRSLKELCMWMEGHRS